MRRFGLLAAIALPLQLPLPAAAEGAVQDLTCAVTAACDAGGVCAPGGPGGPGGEVAIALAPISSEGTINVVAVTIGGEQAEALQDGQFGALEWTTDTASHWLIPAGPSRLVWIVQTVGDAVAAETRLLDCGGAG